MTNLAAMDRTALLRLARETLEQHLGNGTMPGFPTGSPAILEPRATFVTLRHRTTHELRGCRGEVVARRPLAESVMHMAIASATDDPRFPRVTVAELSDLHIEISALTPLAPIRPEDVEVGRHGLMIVSGPRSGLLLPQVPTSLGWDREAFLRGVCTKAGLGEDAWRAPAVELYGFEVEAWGEDE